MERDRNGRQIKKSLSKIRQQRKEGMHVVIGHDRIVEEFKNREERIKSTPRQKNYTKRAPFLVRPSHPTTQSTIFTLHNAHPISPTPHTAIPNTAKCGQHLGFSNQQTERQQRQQMSSSAPSSLTAQQQVLGVNMDLLGGVLSYGAVADCSTTLLVNRF